MSGRPSPRDIVGEEIASIVRRSALFDGHVRLITLKAALARATLRISAPCSLVTLFVRS